eukprot:m.292796 g.292796  ORF g.292796 m.292796 type:complete len:1231 (+) comp20010_c0_seq3:159-3851(+)
MAGAIPLLASGTPFATPPSRTFQSALSKKLVELNFALRCAICLEPWKQTVALDCGHYFCRMCAVKQLSKREKCPTCGKHCKKRKMQDVPRMDNIVRSVKLLAKSIQVETDCEIPSPFISSQISSAQNSSMRQPPSSFRTATGLASTMHHSNHDDDDSVVNKVLDFANGKVTKSTIQVEKKRGSLDQAIATCREDKYCAEATTCHPLPTFSEATKDSAKITTDLAISTEQPHCRTARNESTKVNAVHAENSVFKSPSGRHSRKPMRDAIPTHVASPTHGDVSSAKDSGVVSETVVSRDAGCTADSTKSKDITSPELVGTQVSGKIAKSERPQFKEHPRPRKTRRTSRRGRIDPAFDDTNSASADEFDADMNQAISLSLLETPVHTTPQPTSGTTSSIADSVVSTAASATTALMQAAQANVTPASATVGERSATGGHGDMFDSSQTQGFELKISPPSSPPKGDIPTGTAATELSGTDISFPSNSREAQAVLEGGSGTVFPACSSVPLLVDHDVTDTDNDDESEHTTAKKRRLGRRHGRSKRVIVDDDDTDADDDTAAVSRRSSNAPARTASVNSEVHGIGVTEDSTEDFVPLIRRTTRVTRARKILSSPMSRGSADEQQSTAAGLSTEAVPSTNDVDAFGRHGAKRGALRRTDSSDSNGSSSSGSLPDAGLDRRATVVANNNSSVRESSTALVTGNSSGSDCSTAHTENNQQSSDPRRDTLEVPPPQQSRQSLTRHKAQRLTPKNSDDDIPAAACMAGLGVSTSLGSPGSPAPQKITTISTEETCSELQRAHSGHAGGIVQEDDIVGNSSPVSLTPQANSNRSGASVKLVESPIDSDDSQVMLQKLRDLQRQAQQIGDLAPDDSIVQQRVTACVQMQPLSSATPADDEDSLKIASLAEQPCSVTSHKSPSAAPTPVTPLQACAAVNLSLPESSSHAHVVSTRQPKQSLSSTSPAPSPVKSAASSRASVGAVGCDTTPARRTTHGAGNVTMSAKRTRIKATRAMPTPTKPAENTPPVVLLTGVDLRADKHKWKAFQKLVVAKNGKNVREYSSDVTHLITCADDKNMAKRRTLKLMRAIAEGKWVVNTHWADACLKSKSFGLEEGFELQGWCDDVDVTGGPAKSRVEHTKQRLPLFAGWSFYIHGSQPGAGQDEIIELLKSTGATVLDVLPQEMQPRTAVLVSGEWNNESLSPVDTLDISFVFDSITTYDIRDIDGYRVVSTGDDEEVGTPSLF